MDNLLHLKRWKTESHLKVMAVLEFDLSLNSFLNKNQLSEIFRFKSYKGP